jgi:rhodanese-related sulfurtransferase
MNRISAEECKHLLQAKAAEVIDVREAWEYNICHIGAPNVPMHTVTEAIASWDKTGKYVILCKTGKRAEAVANLLERDYGFTDISILEGGITAWYAAMDPTYEIY